MNRQSNSIDKIEADSVIVEVIDKHTGEMYRRTLPVIYLETDNGIILSGETMDGSPSQLNFLSEAALTKINELLGKGPDSPRCNHD